MNSVVASHHFYDQQQWQIQFFWPELEFLSVFLEFAVTFSLGTNIIRLKLRINSRIIPTSASSVHYHLDLSTKLRINFDQKFYLLKNLQYHICVIHESWIWIHIIWWSRCDGTAENVKYIPLFLVVLNLS